MLPQEEAKDFKLDCGDKLDLKHLSWQEKEELILRLEKFGGHLWDGQYYEKANNFSQVIDRVRTKKNAT